MAETAPTAPEANPPTATEPPALLKFFILGAGCEIAGLALIGVAAFETLDAFDRAAEAVDAAGRDAAQTAALPWLAAMIFGAILFAAGIVTLVFAIRWKMQASDKSSDEKAASAATDQANA